MTSNDYIFDYEIKVYNISGAWIADINNATSISFDLTQNAGCGNFSVTLARKFDDFASVIAFNNEIRIYLNGTLYYTGIIIDYIPTLDLSENVVINGVGYMEQLNWQLVSGTFTSTEVSQLCSDIVTTYTVPYGNISIGTIEAMGYVIDSITFQDQTVKDVLQVLQDISGVSITEVDELKKFNVKIRTLTASLWDIAEWDTDIWDGTVGNIHYVFVGGNVKHYEVINSSNTLRNSIKLKGARDSITDIVYTRTRTDATSIAAYKERQEVVTVSSIDNNADADQYLIARLRLGAYPTKRTTFIVNNYFTIIRPGDVVYIRNTDGIDYPHFVISAGYEVSDAGLNITIQGDTLTPNWSTDWKRIGKQLVNLQNQNP